MSKVGLLRAKIAQLARRQYGHVARRQLLTLGVPSRTIGGWVQKGWLIPVHLGVYAVGYRRVEPIARAAAALLACGSSAVLSHGTALALWGLSRHWPTHPELSGPKGHRRAGIQHHRTNTLTAATTTTERGLSVTSPARTLTDMRPRLSERRYIRLINDARLKGLLSADAAAALHPDAHAAEAPTRSQFEDEVSRTLKDHGFPEFAVNARVFGREVDLLFPAQRLIVELDGWAYHSDRDTQERDRVKDAQALARGYVTVRITWRRWSRARSQVLTELRAVLQRIA